MFVAMQPWKTGVPLRIGVAAFCADLVLVTILCAHPLRARVGALISGLFMAVPCFVRETPLTRLLLACFMCLPLAAATALILTPPIAGFRARLAHLCGWSD